jgi:hypothetical protein
MKEPQNKGELKAFLAAVNFVGTMIPGLVRDAQQLFDLVKVEEGGAYRKTHGSRAIILTPEHRQIIKKIHNNIQNIPIFAFPNENLPIDLHTDASNRGISSVFSQSIDGQQHLLACYSRAWKGQGKNSTRGIGNQVWPRQGSAIPSRIRDPSPHRPSSNHIPPPELGQ